jgi:hypothetical protein
MNTVKYDTNHEITNTYENLQIVQSHFFTNKLIFIYVWSDSNIYWFISIQIRCATNTNKELFGYIHYL